jgi:hypothetical protein
VRMLDQCSEEFNQHFSAEQLLALWRAYSACAYDMLPSLWVERQLVEALRGKVPTWVADAGLLRPLY